MDEPVLNVKADKDWLAWLDQQHVESFYHNPRIYAWLRARNLSWLKPVVDFFAPRGYSGQDAVGGPSAGDAVVLPQSVVDATVAGIKEYRRTGKIPFWAWLKMNSAPHEYSHCMVRLVDGKAILSDLERFSHPNALVPALAHAKRTGWQINTFTGLLRLHIEPRNEVFEPFIGWFERQTAAPVRQ